MSCLVVGNLRRGYGVGGTTCSGFPGLNECPNVKFSLLKIEKFQENWNKLHAQGTTATEPFLSTK